MPQQILNTIENNFVGGLKTENSPLNFPENACTDTDNCIFSITGETSRRFGMDFEENKGISTISVTSKALSSYKWNNAGGDGETQILAQQIGSVLYFFLSSAATVSNPLSSHLLLSAISLDAYRIAGNSTDTTECQYADGNGYLFVFNPNMNTLYCSYSAGIIVANPISVQIRDFNGITETTPVNYRPGVLSSQHLYNLNNQGWTQGSAWTATDTTHAPFTAPAFGSVLTTGTHTFTITGGLPITNGDNVQVYAPDPASQSTLGILNPSLPIMTGSVTSYVGTTLTLNVYSVQAVVPVNTPTSLSPPFTFNPINLGYVNTWFSDIGNYPSNADVWWRFKNASNVFDPGTTNVSVTLNTGPAPKGHYILEAFNQQRDLISGINGLTDVVTNVRPKTGTWFQGRVFYAGPDDSQAATGDQLHYSWSENIYFSQVIENISQLGYCYQNNDPTSEDFFDLLPTDGGVIRIQGCGSIFKLFPVQNGMLVFAANGIWFITGSQGIGFAANDYTITKISSVQSISGTSFVNVLGWPTFWNEEGIYSVSPSPQGGGLTVEDITLNTIGKFYASIPTISKKYARGDYNPLTYIITWVYRDTNETDITSRYRFNRALNVNTSSKAFYPWTFVGNAFIHDVRFVSSPGGSLAPAPVFKYLTSWGNDAFLTFSEEIDNTNWVDFKSVDEIGESYESFFITGYKLHGQALTKFQPLYIIMYSNALEATGYKIQSIWDFANSPNSGKYSSIQLVTNAVSRFGIIYRRHKIRGRGIALQFKVISKDGLPFSIVGWATMEAKNAGI